MLDTKALAEATATIVRSHVEAAVAPLLRRIEVLEARKPERGEKGEPGARGEVGPVGPQGEPGPRGEDGAPGRAGDRGPIGEKGEPGPAGEAGPTGPQGEDGARGEQGPAGPAGPAGEAGEKGVDGRDGVGMAGALIDRSGNLVVTLTNGEHKNLGPVVGKDGAAGRDGDPGARGTDGRDGVDGVGFDDLDLVENEKGLSLRFARGDVVKEFHLPVVIDRGVWRPREYAKGSGVTWGGSFWIAQRDTSDKPETSDAWRLAVKRGQNGKDGKAS